MCMFKFYVPEANTVSLTMLAPTNSKWRDSRPENTWIFQVSVIGRDEDYNFEYPSPLRSNMWSDLLSKLQRIDGISESNAWKFIEQILALLQNLKMFDPTSLYGFELR